MTDITIIHNPRCSKSRQTLALLEEKGLSPVVVQYLKSLSTPQRLKTYLKNLTLNRLER